MTKKIILSLLALTTLSFAEGNPNKEKMISEVKSQMITMTDKHIQILNEYKSCINTANSKDAIKTCGEQRKQKSQSLKAERQEMKQEFREKMQESKSQK